MTLPYIYMTYGTSISIRFPKVEKDNVSVVLGENKGKLPIEAYTEGSPAQIALTWAETFNASWSVFERECGGYNVTIRFDRMNDALCFKNNFMSKVHGVA